MKMNFKVRAKNPVFLVQIGLSILMPILAYFGMTAQDLTSWGVLIQTFMKAIQNPYVLGIAVVSVWNALNDPTTKGLKDSDQALTYKEPKE